MHAGFPAREAALPGCRLLNGKISFTAAYSGDCGWRTIWRNAVKAQNPAVVLMVIGAWDLFDIEPPGSDHFIAPGSSAWNSYYARQLDDRDRDPVRPGGPGRHSHAPVPGRPPGGAGQHQVVLQRRTGEGGQRGLAGVVARHPGKVESPDVFGLICPLGRFQIDAQGVGVVRSDGVHYTAAGAALVANFLAPALRGSSSAKPRTAKTRIVLAYGDSLLNETRETVSGAFGATSDIEIEITAQPLAALCDMTGWLQRDLAVSRPALVVLETRGVDSSVCMRTASGAFIARGSPEYYAKFESDATRFFREARAAGVPVLVVADPPEKAPSEIAVQTRLTSILHSLASTSTGSVVSDIARDALGGSTWTKTMPCLAAERARPECEGSGRIVVRGPNGVNLCPSVPTFGATCATYSSGAIRYASAVVTAIKGATKLNGPSLSIGTPTSLTPQG